MAYDVHDHPRITVKFYVSGVLTDPTTLVFKFHRSDANDQNPLADTTYTYGVGGEIVKDSTGVYHVDIDLTASGVYHYQWLSTGTAAGADEGKFTVNPSAFP